MISDNASFSETMTQDERFRARSVSCQLKACDAKLFSNFLNCLEDLGGCLFSRIGDAAFICSHLAFVDAYIFGEFADIDEIKVIKERGKVVAVFNVDAFQLRRGLALCLLLFDGLLDAFHEVGFGFLHGISVSAKVAIAKVIVRVY